MAKKTQMGKIARYCVTAVLVALMGVGFVSCADNSPGNNPKVEKLSAGAVASPNQFGAETAKQILEAGGNAVDAAVAVAFTLAVTLPSSGNIGGGGFMTIVMDGKPYFMDYREKAPGAATSTMYLDQAGNLIPRLTLDGGLASGVPGTVAGLWEAHKRFGLLPWAKVMAPAIDYAENGFIAYMTATTSSSAARSTYNDYFGGKMTTGSLFIQRELAQTLLRISTDGGPEFYNGKTADLLVAQMGKSGGIITKTDLQNYKAIWRDPVTINWNGLTVYTAPPPSSGGIGIGQLLKMKSDLATRFASAPLNSAQYIHLTAEMEKRIFADRAQYLGDSDFFQVPMAALLADDYNARRAAEVNPLVPTPLANVQPGLGLTPIPPTARTEIEKPETNHFSVVDKWGNAVGNTYTINGGYGSGVVVEGAGFLLNDEMDDFAAKPGVPNLYGVVGGDVNAVAPNKRPLSSMSPTIVTDKDGNVLLVLGTPGGSRIFNAVYQVLVDVYDPMYNLPLDQAQANPRFHHQLLPDNVIYYEKSKFPQAVTDDLTARGWIMTNGLGGGDNIQAIQIVGNRPLAVSDPRNTYGYSLVIPK